MTLNTSTTRNREPIASVTVLIPTFNRAGYIRECLASVLCQTVPPHQVIVIDDGSQDGTAAILNEFEKSVTILRQPNGGKDSAVNLGLKHASGEYIWIFDDDDVALPDSIEKRVAVLDTRPELGFVISGHYQGKDGSDGRIVRGRLYEVPCHSQQEIFLRMMNGYYFTLQSILARTSCYQEIGGLDETLLRSQDYDIMIRLAQRYPCAVLNEPTFIFRQHMGHRCAKGMRYAGQQRSKIFQKYDHKVGLKLRSALSLGDYLVPRTDNVNMIEKTRQALLARMVVMASKGCIAEMFEDLKAALETLQSGQRLSDSETSLITSSICTGYAYAASQVDWPTFKICVAQIGQHIAGKQAVRALAKGFFLLAKSYPGSAVERARKLSIAIAIWIGLCVGEAQV